MQYKIFSNIFKLKCYFDAEQSSWPLWQWYIESQIPTNYQVFSVTKWSKKSAASTKCLPNLESELKKIGLYSATSPTNLYL